MAKLVIMKKAFSFLGWLIVIALIVAAFTVPSKEDCRKYVLKNITDTATVHPYINEMPFKLLGAKIFSTFTVNYYKPITLNDLRNISAKKDTVKSVAKIAVDVTKNQEVTGKYIGAWGTFWKW